MPALNVEFSEEEMEELRRFAQREGLSLKQAVVVATVAHIHADRVHRAIVATMGINAGLSARLADK